MKIVLHTQHRENYGAHDWDGKGECPQYWKFKGGDTYVVPRVSVKEAQSDEFWKSLHAAIESSSEFFEEYVVGSQLVDDVDYVESDHVEEWDSITSLVPVRINSDKIKWLATRIRQADVGWRKGIESCLEQWVQEDGVRVNFKQMFNMEDGRSLVHDEVIKELNQAETA